ncbi:hypothetical protein ACWDV7_35875 [Streptomyces sp. NPDC003362]
MRVPGAYAEVRDADRTWHGADLHDGALLALYQQALCGDGNPETDTASLSPAPS